MRRHLGIRLAAALVALVAFGAIVSPALADETAAGMPLAGSESVEAAVSTDERSVLITASGADLGQASRVVFRVAPEGDAGKALLHEAVRRPDGTWQATAFVARNSFGHGPVPYGCRVQGAVHRLYDPASYRHLYTADLHEADVLSSGGWTYEGVAWVEPHEEAAVLADDGDAAALGAADAAAPVPDEPDPEMLEDASESEPEAEADAEVAEPEGDATAQALDGDMAPEHAGAADPESVASELTAPAPEAQPVYRLYSVGRNEHLYTTDAHEYDVLPSQGWTQEGRAFTSDPAKGRPVYRLYDPEGDQHLYTTDAHERSVLLGRGWSDEGCEWYGATLNADGTWSAASQNRFHDSAGTYLVEATATFAGEAPGAEAEDASGAERSVGQASFSITQPSASAHVANIDNARGTFDVVVDEVVSPSGVSSVQVPTWSAENAQKDIVWYEAEPQGDGTYVAHASVARHTISQNFTSHVYLEAGNGLTPLVASTNTHLTLVNYIRCEGGPYAYRVSIFNPGDVRKVQMPTWSDAGGQDDIIWFDAKNQGNGLWTADIDATRLSHSGTVHTHVYADDTLRGSVDFSILPYEIRRSTPEGEAIVRACYEVPSPGGNLCAAWVSLVHQRALGRYPEGDANEMYELLTSTDLADLMPGMALGVSTHPHTTAGRRYGHIAIYVGGGLVMDNVGEIRTTPLEWWLRHYGVTVPVRWGWL